MGAEGWIVIGVIVGCFLVLLTSTFPADLVFICGLTVLIVSNAVPSTEALVGFSNEGMLTVAALYVVAAGLKETGAIQGIVDNILGASSRISWVQIRLMGPVIVISAFMNNTPVVASFIPALESWSKKNSIPVSKLLIPLSYASILGGTCTLIGTSTNLVVNGLLLAEETTRGLRIFELAYIGVPCAIAGFLYILLAGKKLLPDRGLGYGMFGNPKEYTVEMMVEEHSAIAGQTLREAGLYNLPGLFVVNIYRNGDIIRVDNPRLRLRKNDRLIFIGPLESIMDLQQSKGLRPATDQIFKLETPRPDRLLVEAVISPSHPVNQRTISQGRFRNLYEAVVLAVARNGQRIHQEVNKIKLRPGDTLLLETGPSFLERYKNSRDYYLISPLTDYHPVVTNKMTVAWAILAGMVALATTGVLSMFQASFLAAAVMVISGCCRPRAAKDNMDWTVLIVIASSIGIGNAMEVTGVAGALADRLLTISTNNPYLLLAATYLTTTILTEVINNNSAAVLVFPIIISLASSLQLDYLPFAVTVMMAASASFATPIGYQTNLMVYGPGGYRFSDFIKVGAPLNIILGVITVLLVPHIWPF